MLWVGGDLAGERHEGPEGRKTKDKTADFLVSHYSYGYNVLFICLSKILIIEHLLLIAPNLGLKTDQTTMTSSFPLVSPVRPPLVNMHTIR